MNGSVSIDPDLLRAELAKMPEWEELRQEIIAKAILLTDKLSYDFRRMLTHGRNADMAGRLMWRLIKPFEPQVLIGPGFGAMPLLFAAAMAALADGVDLTVLMVRDKRKEHNQKMWVEGNRAAAAGKRAVMVDDFMLAGTALPLVRQALKADKVDVNLVALALFFDMWQPLGSRQISTSQLPVVSLFKRHDIGLSRDCYDAVPPLMKGAAPDLIGVRPRWWRLGLNHKLAYPTKCVPAIAGNAVFVADEHSVLWKHDLHSGDILWSVPSLAQPLKAIVQQLRIVEGDPVYGCYDGSMTRVNGDTGDVVWRWRIDSSIHATPEIDLPNNRLFINTEQWNDGNPTGHIQCLNLDTGRLIWKHRHAWWPPGSAAYCSSTRTVIAPCNDETLVAVDADTGALLWTRKTEGLVRGRPLIKMAVGEPRLYAATERGRLHCIDLRTGEVLWTRRYGEGLFHQFLTANDEEVFVLDGKWHFCAFELETGAIRWLTRLRSPGRWQPVACGDYRVVLSREGHLAVLDPINQRKVWEGHIPGVYHQPPAIALQPDGGAILVAASSTAGLLAYDLHSHYALPIERQAPALTANPATHLLKEAA